MFRLKIVSTYVIGVLLLAGVSHFYLTGTLVPEMEDGAETSIRRAAVIAEQTKRMDHFALAEKAEALADDPELYRRMRLDKNKDLLKRLREEYAGGGEAIQKKLGEEKAAKRRTEDDTFKLTYNDVRHLAVHERLLVDKYRYRDERMPKAEGRRNMELDLLHRKPVRPDLVMALDRDGVGVAALGETRYSWFGRDVAKDHGALLSVVQNPNETQYQFDVWRWSWKSGDDPSLYQVAIAPIRSSVADEPAGVIVMGYSIDDGTARDSQRLLSGITVDDDAAPGVDVDDLPHTPELAYFYGGQIYGSTFDTKSEEKLRQVLFEQRGITQSDDPEQRLLLEYKETTYQAFVRFFPGQFDVDNPTGFVIMSNLDKAKQPVYAVSTNIWYTAAGIALLGLLLLLMFYQQFIKPIEEIEESIGDVLSGNKDASFVLSSEGSIFNSLAQGLNLMSAYLQGKPMPDEEAELEGWGELVDDNGNNAGSSGGGSGGDSPDVQGVEMPGMGGGGGAGDGGSDDGDGTKS
jgi:hypothetical protein